MKILNLIRKIGCYYLPWLSLMAVIFYLSSIPELVIVEESSWDLLLRKLAHVLVYFFLYLLTFRLFVKEKIGKPFLFSAIFTIIYAISDEYHQTFVFGRVGAVSDVAIDSLGVLAGYLLLSNYRALRDFIR